MCPFLRVQIPNYADGIGYATTIGVMDDERTTVEASPGGKEEDSSHTYGDTLKILESLTYSPRAKVDPHFVYWTKTKIPVQYQERHDWLQIFELVAHLQDLVEEKRIVDDELRREHADVTIDH
ncbi:hypothetical protein VTP01DRAFT_5495 [Rhizomucor pusillus]|uniref:uncharacterized protein n=1 Tax=Rhizomucor pusillus TaxID=4840 RepID=UPI003743F558